MLTKPSSGGAGGDGAGGGGSGGCGGSRRVRLTLFALILVVWCSAMGILAPHVTLGSRWESSSEEGQQ